MDEQEVLKTKMEFYIKFSEVAAFVYLTTIIAGLTMGQILLEKNIVTVEYLQNGFVISGIISAIIIFSLISKAFSFYQKFAKKAKQNGQHTHAE